MKKWSTFYGQNAVDAKVADYQGWSGILAGCVPDARDLAIATATMGYTATARFSGWNVNGKVLPWAMSGQCTIAAWRETHAVLQACVQPGDSVIIGNSGHGGQYNTSEVNGGHTLCFFDGLFRDTQQYELTRAWPEGVNVLYVFDSCHSGGLDRHAARAPIRAAPYFVKPRGPTEGTVGPPSQVLANVVEFCACRAAETAEDGPQNGAFTGSLLAVWDQAQAKGTKLTFHDWIDATVELMAGNFAQHPTVNLLGGGTTMLNTLI